MERLQRNNDVNHNYHLYWNHNNHYDDRWPNNDYNDHNWWPNYHYYHDDDNNDVFADHHHDNYVIPDVFGDLYLRLGQSVWRRLRLVSHPHRLRPWLLVQ